MKDSRTTIVSKRLPKPRGPYSYGVKAGGWVFTAGMLGVDGKGNLVGKTPGRLGAESQTKQTLENLIVALEELGASREKVAKVNGYMTDFRYLDRFNAVYREFFKPPYPARAILGKGLALEDAMIEVDAIATVSGTPREVRSSKLADWEWPSAQGGTQVGDVFFSSGHLSRDAKGQLNGRGDIRAQTEQALDNLGAALDAAGFDFPDVMKINATVPDWYGFNTYNQIFMKYFREPFEARATIQGEIEQEGVLIEFEAVAGKGGVKRIIESEVPGDGHFALKKRADTIYLKDLPGALAPHSHAVQVSDLVYLCGQIGYDASGRLVGPSDIRAQTRKTMENHRLCMEALGGTLNDIVKTHVSIIDHRLIPGFNEEYAKFFSPPYPARTTVVAGLAQLRMVLEIEAIAVLGASKNAVVLTGPER
jgi:2-iminobutanoate/2-iminopropanoate deaminase